MGVYFQKEHFQKTQVIPGTKNRSSCIFIVKYIYFYYVEINLFLLYTFNLNNFLYLNTN